MSVLFCTTCPAVIDPQEDDYSTDSNDRPYCDNCYRGSPSHCEDDFDRNGDCICGEHTVCRAERDVGINEPYLELR
jgi:hypothetical protein